MNLIFFGFKNSGKTTLGKLTAEKLGRPFIDTDHLLEQLHSEPIRNLHRKLGEKKFRALESELLYTLEKHQNAIISVGGGLILDPQNAATLAKLGALVYLKLDKETLKKRTLRDLPSFLDPNDPEGSFEKMYEERVKIYEATSAHTLNLENKTQDQVLLEILALIPILEKSHG